ncbi:hypothetical protein CH72_2279 [Burkholderia ambifaria AMMD]|uniref:DUF2486 domain-containing protein n=1 Tax=Burkholderia ambifaria (strain ATCC BAA-244 / DSM 16087 / CCUG 44356 / LMG 19182 / AMMD) TaxID=339670 RepID=Q0BCQ4_BURCM|nr:DUF2486 family protein [Burkholderia ambifaria]ABI88069.1 conserved hypothetical protein [Burkholderia ambifaria AMMD]AJY22417.1 hypothetical protein CH72_2279 [Burkholderia ambifaria AMMD]MBR7932814.1 DUF2486 family protein [Burkholderia ambifaria]MBR8346489.1 DUF2486 family protein [Burkholderia ambifaria]PEH64771.1 DUF2486 domain-containing protein [Burkholderia ambifaria]
MTQAESSSIPTLTDVLVPGKPVPARSSAADMPPRDDAAVPEHTGTDPEFVVVEPVPTPHVPTVELPGDSDAPALPGAAGRVVAEEAAGMQAPLRSALAADDAQQPGFAAVPAQAGEAMLPHGVAPGADELATDHLAAAVVQPDTHPAAALTPEDAQHIAERLRNRLTNYLTGEGREAIEARCRDALHDHTAWLVGQITREVALALETEVMEWVRDAVDEEIARRGTGRSG